MKINVVIPMAGLGSRFSKVGYNKPKPFIDVLGKPMIERVIENLKIENATYILIARKEHIENYPDTVEEIKDKYNAIFLPIDMVTEGAACTVLFAREYINSDNPLIIANSDQIVDIKIKDFVQIFFSKIINIYFLLTKVINKFYSFLIFIRNFKFI